MSNEVNMNKMYQFIASFNKNGGSWVDVADGYGNAKKDGIILHSEFEDFVRGEFANWNGNEGGTVSDDLIEGFWKKLDTNKSNSYVSGSHIIRNNNALDKNELENLEKRLEVYVKFDEFVAK